MHHKSRSDTQCCFVASTRRSLVGPVSDGVLFVPLQLLLNGVSKKTFPVMELRTLCGRFAISCRFCVCQLETCAHYISKGCRHHYFSKQMHKRNLRSEKRRSKPLPRLLLYDAFETWLPLRGIGMAPGLQINSAGLRQVLLKLLANTTSCSQLGIARLNIHGPSNHRL